MKLCLDQFTLGLPAWSDTRLDPTAGSAHIKAVCVSCNEASAFSFGSCLFIFDINRSILFNDREKRTCQSAERR